MSAADAMSWTAIAVALLVLILNAAYISSVGPDPWAFANVILSLYFICVYLVGLYSSDVYIIRSGIMTRIGVIAVLVMMAVDSIVRWKRGQDAS